MRCLGKSSADPSSPSCYLNQDEQILMGLGHRHALMNRRCHLLFSKLKLPETFLMSILVVGVAVNGIFDVLLNFVGPVAKYIFEFEGVLGLKLFGTSAKLN